MDLDPLDAQRLRLAFAVARRSRADGNHPFGAVLVGPDGDVLLEQGTASRRKAAT